MKLPQFLAMQTLNRVKLLNAFWVALYFFIIIGSCYALYYALYKIDYIWRWNRVGQYFISTTNVVVKSEYKGVVSDIKKDGDQTRIQVTAGDKTQTYTVPKNSVDVTVGQIAFAGDVLAKYTRKRPGLLMQGLWVTLYVSVYATILGIIIGLFAGLARISKNPTLKWLSITYIELIRGSPLLVQIFIWYFALGTLVNNLLAQEGFENVSPLWFGVAALACFAGAYIAEIVRSGIQSIHRGQTEAARSLGMNPAQTMFYIILPQALRRILPPLAGQFISLIKDSSLLGIIAIRELSKATREAVTSSLMTFELWTMCAILYLVLTFTLSMFVQYLERRTSVS